MEISTYQVIATGDALGLTVDLCRVEGDRYFVVCRQNEWLGTQIRFVSPLAEGIETLKKIGCKPTNTTVALGTESPIVITEGIAPANDRIKAALDEMGL